MQSSASMTPLEYEWMYLLFAAIPRITVPFYRMSLKFSYVLGTLLTLTLVALEAEYWQSVEGASLGPEVYGYTLSSIAKLSLKYSKPLIMSPPLQP